MHALVCSNMFFKQNEQHCCPNLLDVMQVLHALLPILCSKDVSQQIEGAQQFAIQQIGGHVCLQGVFQVTNSLWGPKSQIVAAYSKGWIDITLFL